MKNVALAIAAMAFAPLALAAEGQGDETQPTMLELKQSIDALGVRLGRVENSVAGHTTTLGTHTTKLDTLSSTITANHATIVGKFAQQVAVATTVPSGTYNGVGYWPAYYLVADSTIPSFPSGTVATDGRIGTGSCPNLDGLPVGTCLFELQQPYSDNVLCNGSVSRRHGVAGTGGKFNSDCPRVRLQVRGSPAWRRQDDGSGVYNYTAGNGGHFNVLHKFPAGFTFTDDKPLNSYVGAVRITKLK